MAYDLIILPLDAFDLPDATILTVMHVSTTIVWTIDILLSFFRGFEARGVIEMRPKKVALHYVQTWLAIDTAIVTVDWVSFFMSLEWLKLLRLRILRLLRVARLVKLTSRILVSSHWAVSDIIRSDNGLAILSVLGLMTGLALINHYVACGWYFIGSLKAYARKWTEGPFEIDDSFGYRYSTSFHWSITQFTPASMEIVPANSLERAYTVIIILAGLLMFSTLLSSITATMNRLRQITLEKRGQESLIRRYISENRVSLQLGNQIVTHFRKDTKRYRRRLHADEIPALSFVPEELLIKLSCEVFGPILAGHGLFLRIKRTDAEIWSIILNQAVSERALHSGEELFRVGNKGTKMFFITMGEMAYSYAYSTDDTPWRVRDGEWMCEAVLWTRWEHRGRLTAASSCCDMLELNASEFQAIILASSLRYELARYARFYANRAVRECGFAEKVSDLWGSKKVVDDLAHRAFKGEEEDGNPGKTMGKLLMLWDSDEMLLQHVFTGWKYVSGAQKAKSGRRKRKCCYRFPCCICFR